MKASTEQPSMRRLETGLRCQSKDCDQTALWLIANEGNTAHLCPKHTRSAMRDQKKWGTSPMSVGLGA
ncbi:MAG TPA: hypothetical protein VFE91_06060 [Nitrososphaerales archaeon]|nr:hypothetical protein [Nitrososphaerales archaeon]